jgi:transglutaminase-like putative cysteine protease
MSAGIDARVDRGLLGAGEVALALVTVSVVGGFSRLFRDNSYFGKMAALAVVSHVLASIVRRLGRSIVWSGAISAIGLAVVGGVVFYADTTFAGLPTLATRDAAIADLRLAWNLFGTVRAPAPVEPGFVLAGAIAVWVVAFLADWAAFRVWSTLEALFPASIVFVFAALLGRGQYRLVATAIFGGAVLVFVLVHRLAKSEMTCSWLAHDPNDGRLALARIGLFGIATAVVLGLVVGPALPGAGEEAVLAWRDLDGGGARSGARVTVSPLVDIQARLVSQSSAEVFTVRSPSPEYWRLTALDRFDGVAWTSSGSYSRAGDNLATRLPPSVPTRTLEQTFTISKLAALWLPAAFEPAAVVDDGDSGARYEAESGTLTVKEGKETSDGLTYTIQSRIPQRDRAAVQAGTTALPTEFRLRYTDVPSRVSSYLRDYLNEASTRQLMGLGNGRLTNRSPYEQALLVQNFFRNNFAYDLEVAAGHSVNDIQSFVRARKGYCEQFAGTFAAMMRTLGVPARVAVGFTPGELQSDGLYHVRGEHAHAWPEVFLSGVGWVRFEPTPNRGAPGDEAYTGVVPAQEEGSLPESSPTPTTAPGDPTDPVDVPPDLNPSELDGLATSGGDPAEDNGAPSSIEGIQQILLVALIIALSTVLAVGVVPFLKFVQRRRRRSRAVGQPRQEIGVSWAETVDALGLLDLDATAAQTPSEVAHRSAPTLGDAAPDLERLAELTTRATFDAGEPAADEVAAASSAARSVRASVIRRVTRRRRAMRALDPRPLLPRAQLRG